MRYYFNPNYILCHDVDKTILATRFEFTRLVEDIEHDFNFYAAIHPIQAIILSFFDGKELDATWKEISTALGVDVEQLKKHFEPLIDNKNWYTMDFEGKEIVFPNNVIVSVEEEITNYIKSDPLDYADYTEFKQHNGRTNRPTDLTLMLSTICYTDCTYCYADRSKKMNCAMPTEKIKDLINEAGRLKMRNFELMGGEVFMHPDWREILQCLSDNNLIPFFSTKMPMSEEDIKFLSSLNVPDFQISLDSANIEVLKPLVKVKDDYLALIDEMMNNLDKYNVKYSIHTILTKANTSIREMDDLLDFLKNRKKLYVWKVDPVQDALYIKNPIETLKPDDEAYIELSNYLDNKDFSGLPFKFQFTNYDSAETIIEKKTREDFLYTNTSSCPANKSMFYILPDGQVTVCEQLFWHPQYIIGNICDSTIMELWASEKAVSMYEERLLHAKPDSPCYSCEDKKRCSDLNLICYKNIVIAHGNRFDMPDPRCPKF